VKVKDSMPGSLERNNLFPVFLKLEDLRTLIVGAGPVGLEKLTAILKSSPKARVTIVGEEIIDPIRTLVKGNKNIRLVERVFRIRDLHGNHIIILATDDKELHKRIHNQAKKRHVLLNVADTPELCDFYLGSVVTKGNIKVGISTNGKSPTMAKRIREFFEEVIPEETNELLDNMNQIRERVKGDFQQKVKVLNEITSSWLRKDQAKK
jgi:precorrin-2 dehydrogenase / sirohydrochlorin ferrochelatase